MSLQGSGAISISQIKSELGSGSNSLRALSSAAGKSTPDSMSEFYGFSLAPATIMVRNNESKFGGDANLRLYAYNASGTNILSEYWFWGDYYGNLGTETGITFYQGYTISAYGTNWGSSTQRLRVVRNGAEIYNNCQWSDVGPYDFTVNGGDSILIEMYSNTC